MSISNLVSLDGFSSLHCSACRLFQQEKRTFFIYCNEVLAEVDTTEDEDSLPKEAQMSIVSDPDELHSYAAYAT
jgi:protein OS-9